MSETSGRALLRGLLTGPLRAASRAELLYAVLALPLAVLGFVWTLFSLVGGVALALTPFGVPLLAGGLHGARGLGAVQRRLATSLLGVAVDGPRPFRSVPRGVIGFLGTTFTDTTCWRAVLFALLRLPFTAAAFALTAGIWVYGAYLLTSPLSWAVVRAVQGGPESPTARLPGTTGTAGSVLVVLAGLALLVLAPVLTHGVQYPDRLLTRLLLGPGKVARRVRDLEQSRTRAVDDATAMLRGIERDLHDGAQARLVALAMNLGLVRVKLAGDDPEALASARRLVDSAHHDAKAAIAELRDLSRGIYPSVLDEGLDVALESLTSRSGVPATLRTQGLPERAPSPAIAVIAYFCVAELITNATRHSRARNLAVTAHLHPDKLLLRVTDDGIGGAEIRPGHGLAGLTDRVRTVDGRLTSVSPVGGPTEVVVELPLHA
ncbi:sensor domain-containing protein [Actinoplanes sp. NPDC026623]|uniref:sensor histidine kinase n=1 Tax=Actinoplanes sp. NPDC026623 TaxID=3155610 RepID=UPI0033D1C4A9